MELIDYHGLSTRRSQDPSYERDFSFLPETTFRVVDEATQSISQLVHFAEG
jgi:hypothetical protein